MIPPTRFAAAAAAIGLCLALTACGSDVEDIPGLTPDGVSVDTSKDGEVTIETDDGSGSFTSGSGALPEGFPADDIPVVEGDVQNAIVMNNDAEEGYAVIIAVKKADHAKAVALLTAKGFTVKENFGGGGTETAQLTSPAWSVLLSTSDVDPESPTVSYTVRKVQG